MKKKKRVKKEAVIRRGRPRLKGQETMNMYLPPVRVLPSHYRKIMRRAKKNNETISGAIRSMLISAL